MKSQLVSERSQNSRVEKYSILNAMLILSFIQEVYTRATWEILNSWEQNSEIKSMVYL